MQQPFVSICIPTYNGAAFLAQSLQSAMEQTYKNLEIIVCDDCSGDETVAIAEQFAATDPRIKIFRNSKNLGLVGNWEKTISLANYDWIKFLAQDDTLEPGCTEKLLSSCLTNNCKLAICARHIILDNNTSEETRHFYINKLVKPENLFSANRYYSPKEMATIINPYLLENVLGEPTSILFHNSLKKEHGFFNAAMRQLVDYEFLLRNGLNNGIFFTNEKLCGFSVHNQSESAKNNDVTKQKDLKINHVRAVYGDALVFLEEIKNNPDYKELQQYWTNEKIELLQKFQWLKAIKRNGKSVTLKALKEIAGNIPAISSLKFSLFKYVLIKKKLKKLGLNKIGRDIV